MDTTMKMVTRGHLDWLEKKLRKQKYSLIELKDEWIRQFGKPVDAKKTFEANLKRNIYRWMERLENENENKNIKIASENGKYYIVGHHYDSIDAALHSKKLLELLEKYPDIHDRILFDIIPSENQYLDKVLYAISNSLVIKFDYISYSDKDPRNPEIIEREVHPYCVKRFENRWYVTGLYVKRGKEKVGEIYNFSLDRIQNFKLTNKKFPPDPTFNAADHFKDVYGIITGMNGPFTEIKIRVSSWLANYLRTLPLHHSQKEISESDNYNSFLYSLKPANDFYNALLHFGKDAEVLEPESVRNEMKKKILEMAEVYNIKLT